MCSAQQVSSQARKDKVKGNIELSITSRCRLRKDEGQDASFTM